MAGESRRPDRRLTYWQGVRERPWAHDFYQLLRRVEAMYPELPRLGEARRPVDEPVRLGQQAALDFAPANVAAVEDAAGGRPRILVRFLGFWGPQGPLPLHLTEFARERERNYDDPTLVAFANVFHHRLLLLFFRAWRQAQPTASRDRPDADRFRTYVGALLGHGPPSWHRRDAVADDAKRFFSGALSRSARNADGLADVLTEYLRVPVQVEVFTRRWLRLPPEQRTRLGARGPASQLGVGVVAGNCVPDAQHHFTLRIGPMAFAAYENLLPSGPWFAKLRDWVREYTGEEWCVRACTAILRDELPAGRLGGSARLGWTTWLGTPGGRGPVAGAEFEVSTHAH